jgi:hypothetical protein
MKDLKRLLPILVLVGFMIATGVYVFVYLARSFQPDAAGGRPLVGIWHGDAFARAILVSVFFLIGEVFLVYLLLSWRRRGNTIQVRGDLWSWLSARSDITGEPAEHIAERAISQYRLRLEGGPHGIPSVSEDSLTSTG